MKYMRINLKADIRRRKAAAVMSVLFCAVLAAISAAAVFLERPKVSLTENRELEKLPEFTLESYLSGEFASKLDKYFTDTVPFRDKLTEYAAVLENARGIPSPQFYGVEIVNDGSTEETEIETFPTERNDPASAETEPPVLTAPAAEQTIPDTVRTETVTETAAPDASETTVTENDEEFVGDINDFLNNGILVNGVDMYGEKAGIMLFGGNKKQGKRYAETISAYKRALGDSVNVYNLVVPTSVEFYLPKRYSKFSNSEKEQIDFIYGELTDGVIPVDAYSVLAEHKDEYIYFRTDHHWSDLGAYYAYTAFCDAIGQTPPPLDSYTVKTKEEPYVGSLFGYTTDITLKNNPDTFTYYMTKSDFRGESFYYDTLASAGANMIYHEYASGSGMYSMFLGSDSMHIKITTSAGTGRKIVMFKESYGNAFAPFLIDSFDEIYIIDIRYFGRNAVDYIKQVGATDVLFINNIFAANTSMLINDIELLLTSDTGTVVTVPPETTPSETVSETTVSETKQPVSSGITPKTPSETKQTVPSETKQTVPSEASETAVSAPTEAKPPAVTAAPVQKTEAAAATADVT